MRSRRTSGEEKVLPTGESHARHREKKKKKARLTSDAACTEGHRRPEERGRSVLPGGRVPGRLPSGLTEKKRKKKKRGRRPYRRSRDPQRREADLAIALELER